MNHFDATLAQPTAEQALLALRDARAAADRRARINPLGWPLADADAFLGRLASEAEGTQEWLSGPPSGRPAARTGVAAAWWRDYGGRTHLRVVGSRGRLGGPSPVGLFGVPRDWPPVLVVHPGTALLRALGEGAAEAVVVCACGAWGPPASVGWMGRRCGPCHDRAAVGAPVPAADWAPAVGPYPVLSPDGGTLATDGPGDELVLWDTHTRQARAVTGLPAGWKGGQGYWWHHVSITPGGDRLLLRRVEGPEGWRLLLWDVEGGAALASMTLGEDTGAVIAAAGGDVVITRHDANPLVWRPGSPPTPLEGGDLPTGYVERVAVSADGRRLAVSRHVAVGIWDLPGRKFLGRLELRDRRGYDPALSPDGSLFANSVGFGRAGADVWDVGEGRPLQELSQPTTEIIDSLCFAPDGRRLAVLSCRGGGVGVWDVADGRALVRCSWGGADVSWADVLADGRLVTVGAADRVVRLWPKEVLFGDGR
jgi:hypothetical protein